MSATLEFPRDCEDLTASVPDSRSEVVVAMEWLDLGIVAVEGCCIDDESFESKLTLAIVELEPEVSRVLVFEVVVPIATG